MPFIPTAFVDGAVMNLTGFTSNTSVARTWLNGGVVTSDVRSTSITSDKIYPPTVLESPINSYQGTFQSGHWVSNPDSATYWNKLTDRIDVFRSQLGANEDTIFVQGMTAVVPKEMDFVYDERFPLYVMVQASFSLLEVHRKTRHQTLFPMQLLKKYPVTARLLVRRREPEASWQKIGADRLIQYGQYVGVMGEDETGLEGTLMILRDKDSHQYSLLGSFLLPEAGLQPADVDVGLALVFTIDKTHAHQIVIGARFLKIEVFRS